MRTMLLAAIFFTTISTARADHFEVFLVAGQSNCDGRGAASALTGPLAKWAKLQDDVIIAYSCSKLRGLILESDGFKPLQTGWSVAPGKARPTKLPSGTFGPELAFGRAMADRMPGKKIALIKYTEGGTSLQKDWNPDVKDRLYAAFLDFTEKSLKKLTDQGHTFTIRGLIWHQGESDAAMSAEDYQKLLTGFIGQVRADLKTPDMPFGIGEVFDNGKRDSIRTAQKKTAEAVKGAFFVPADKLKTFDGGTHFDADSQIELGDSFAKGMAAAIGLK